MSSCIENAATFVRDSQKNGRTLLANSEVVHANCTENLPFWDLLTCYDHKMENADVIYLCGLVACLTIGVFYEF